MSWCRRREGRYPPMRVPRRRPPPRGRSRTMSPAVVRAPGVRRRQHAVGAPQPAAECWSTRTPPRPGCLSAPPPRTPIAAPGAIPPTRRLLQRSSQCLEHQCLDHQCLDHLSASWERSWSGPGDTRRAGGPRAPGPSTRRSPFLPDPDGIHSQGRDERRSRARAPRRKGTDECAGPGQRAA